MVLSHCLAEIERCRPFFLCLLGERYGWVPAHLPSDLLEKEPWLEEHQADLVTALEIFHGVLNDPAMAEHALFYFRSPEYIRQVDPARRGDFSCESADAAKRLTLLKQQICDVYEEGGLKVAPVKRYDTPTALADPEWERSVLNQLTAIIDELYPEDEIPDPLDQEAASHEAFARSRRELFVGREEDLEALNRYMQEDAPPLVLKGESGCGKTALLANWVAQWRTDHPGDFVFQHYIGSTPDSTS